MSEETVISVENVSKAYRIWRSPSARLLSPLREHLAGLLPEESATAQRFRDRVASSYRDFHALRDVSFSVERGETVGIIGRNGSGKSTLLQIIAGTLQPTTGKVTVKGRVAALLELGSAFNPDFTGRENVYLNGAVLGLTRAQVEAKFHDIEAFAGIGDFIDEPIKTYSSGMQLRLAFAVQTAVEPEVLIVDEALSVGDEAFARRCIARINQLRDRGTSLLLVSHSSNLITTLCEKALLFERGHLLLRGSPKQVITRYHRIIFTGKEGDPDGARGSGDSSRDMGTIAELSGAASDTAAKDESCFDPTMVSTGVVAYEPCGIRIHNPRITNRRGIRVNCLSHGCEYTYTYEVEVMSDSFSVVCMCGFRSKEGFELGGIRSHAANESFEHLAAGTWLQVRFPFRCAMLPEVFSLNAGVMGIIHGELTYLHRLVDVLQFRVLPASGLFAAGLISFGNASTVKTQAARSAD